MMDKLFVLLKIVLYTLCTILVVMFMQSVGIFIYEFATTGVPSLNTPQDQSPFIMFIFSGLGLVGTLITTYLFVLLWDSKPLLSIGLSLRDRSKDILMGLLIASMIMSIGFTVMIFTKNISVESLQFNLISLLIYFLAFSCVVLIEEIVFRGYILNNLMKITNRFIALVISSLLFALMHSFNPNMGLLPMINLFIAGLLLGASYIYTQNLWFPISLHLFWNFVQGPILGFKVSGLNTDPIVNLNYSSDNIINGGTFGFEGSILCTILGTLTTLGILLYYRSKETKEQ